jgi:hypothetical protein
MTLRSAIDVANRTSAAPSIAGTAIFAALLARGPATASRKRFSLSIELEIVRPPRRRKEGAFYHTLRLFQWPAVAASFAREPS